MVHCDPARAAVRPLATLALLALVGVGCTSAPAETGGAGNGNAGPNPVPREKLVEFAECMRENGVGDFPNPDDDGAIRFQGGTDTPEFTSARESCRAVLPEGLEASEGAPGGGG
ncbi:MAG: hypothetical protein ACRDXB_17060 [Actinomycetes bacterium]